MNKILAVLIVVFMALAILISAGFYLMNRPTPPAVTLPAARVDSNTLPGLQTGALPWKAEIDDLKKRLEVIGLPALKAEGEVQHTHQHLDLFINGKQTQIPEGIGVNEGQSFISSIHTHDKTGIIHVESPVVQDFTLGQFFDIWGLKFTKNCIGGYCNNNEQLLKVYVNGREVSGDPRSITLGERQEIAITFGKPEEAPEIPKAFKFPEGY